MRGERHRRAEIRQALQSALPVHVITESDESPPQADLIVLVVDPSDSDGLEEVRSSHVPVLAVAHRSRFLELVDAGCLGFVTVGTPKEELAAAVERVLAGDAIVPPDLLGQLLRHVVVRRRKIESVMERLTEREREVFALAVNGANKDDIGRELFISPATARTHLQNVYKKLGVHSQTELMALADSGQEERSDD